MHHSASNIRRNSFDGACKGRPLSHRTHCFYRALMPPGYHKEWSVAVRVASNKKLVAFIAAVPITVRVREKYVSSRSVLCNLLMYFKAS